MISLPFQPAPKNPCSCIRKTYAKIVYAWNEVVKNWGPTRKYPSYSQIILPPGNRAFYLKRMKAAMECLDNT